MFDYCGRHRYFVTCCVHPRRDVFTSDGRVQCVRAEILRTCREQAFALIADLYMPDHVHVVVRGRCDGSEFKPFMTLLRQRTAVAFKAAYREQLWQDGYFERLLRLDEATENVVEYMAANPVRAGLVASIDRFPYLWSSVGVGRPMDDTSLPDSRSAEL